MRRRPLLKRGHAMKFLKKALGAILTDVVEALALRVIVLTIVIAAVYFDLVDYGFLERTFPYIAG